MNTKPTRMFCACALPLMCAFTAAVAPAQPIAVNPVNPSIPVGGTLQFTSTDVTVVQAGGAHTCALFPNGTERCWGHNSNGQLGNGDVAVSSAPVSVVGMTTGTAISSGGSHSCAVLLDGTVECWGLNDVGQLGNGTTTNASAPVRVTGIANAVSVSAGYKHTCAALQDGTVRCWGDNSYGQLGDGSALVFGPVRGLSLFHSATPVTVTGITTAVAVSASRGYHTCAVLQNGDAECWGDNTYGQLGDGTTTSSATPVIVAVRRGDYRAISGGAYHTCGLLTGGVVYCWGLNFSGQLGSGNNVDHALPASVSGTDWITPMNTAVSVSTGDLHSCAALQDGTARCWGQNDHGQLGDGTTNNANAPVRVNGVTQSTQITSAGNHNCVSLHGGSVQCWGENRYNQLGDGTNADAHGAVAVSGMTPTWTSSDPTVATIDANGVATALAAGSTTITATLDLRSGSTTLTVTPR
jgi:alpha-tubulin suppressor-like RCC1 family protein